LPVAPRLLPADCFEPFDSLRAGFESGTGLAQRLEPSEAVEPFDTLRTGSLNDLNGFLLALCLFQCFPPHGSRLVIHEQGVGLKGQRLTDKE
jgi:hypothetical protein